MKTEWKNVKKKIFLVPMILLLLGAPAGGFALDRAEVAGRVEAAYAAIDDLAATFVQKSRVAALGGRTREKEGKIYFRRPGKMRWEYERPEPQLIVSDGVNLWYYRPERKQVVVQELDWAFNSQTPLHFLFGEGRLAEEFTWDEGSAVADGDGRYMLEMKPKEETPDLVALKLEVRSETFTVAATVLRDAFGNETRLEFSGEKVNGGLDDGLFSFEPPPGTEVVTP